MMNEVISSYDGDDGNDDHIDNNDNDNGKVYEDAHNHDDN